MIFVGLRIFQYVLILGDTNIAQILQPKLMKTCDEGIILVGDVRVQKSSDYLKKFTDQGFFKIVIVHIIEYPWILRTS